MLPYFYANIGKFRSNRAGGGRFDEEGGTRLDYRGFISRILCGPSPKEFLDPHVRG